MDVNEDSSGEQLRGPSLFLICAFFYSYLCVVLAITFFCLLIVHKLIFTMCHLHFHLLHHHIACQVSADLSDNETENQYNKEGHKVEGDFNGSSPEDDDTNLTGSGSSNDDSEGSSTEEDSSSSEVMDPWLKYQRLSTHVTQLLTKFAASCLTIHENYMVLGTHQGVVFCLDLMGTELLRYNAHTMKVNAVSIDLAGKNIGSCSEDGSVCIQGVTWKSDSTGNATVCDHSNNDFFFFFFLFFLLETLICDRRSRTSNSCRR